MWTNSLHTAKLAVGEEKKRKMQITQALILVGWLTA
jgi:hypothetical protein